MTQWLEMMAQVIKENVWLAPVLCLLAGVITSFTPCSLSTIPSVIAYVGASSGSDTKKAFRLSVVMALGMAFTFAIFGSLASVIGHVMHDAGHWWSVFLGVLMILMALQIWDVIHIIPHIHMDQNMSRKGYIGAFLIGMLNGVFASHCATPVMIALLAMVAKADGSMIWGIFLMALYAIGHSILLVAAGTSYSAVQAVIDNPKYASFSKALRILMGAVILLIGIFILFAED